MVRILPRRPARHYSSKAATPAGPPIVKWIDRPTRHAAPPGGPAMDVIIYHNPDCETSRNTFAMIRNAGVEPHIIEYLKCPPTRLLLTRLLERAGLTVRQILREKGTPFHDLGLGYPSLSYDVLLDAIGAHPILMNRP